MIFTEQNSVFVIFLLAIRLCFVQHISDSVSAEIFYVEENIKVNTSVSPDKHYAYSTIECAVRCSSQHNCVGASYNIGLQECYTHNVIEFPVVEEFSGWEFLRKVSIY